MKTKKLTEKQNMIQAFKFLLFSCSAGILQAVTFTLLLEVFKISYWPSYLIGLIASVIYNFTVNRKYTFKSDTSVMPAMLKLFGYYLVFTPLSTIVGNYLTESCFWNEYLVLFISMTANLITEFLFCRYVIYKDTINSLEK